MVLFILSSFFCVYAEFIMDLQFQEHRIQTGCGSVSVIVYGDHNKPALITYPDLALNCKRRPFF